MFISGHVTVGNDSCNLCHNGATKLRIKLPKKLPSVTARFNYFGVTNHMQNHTTQIITVIAYGFFLSHLVVFFSNTITINSKNISSLHGLLSLTVVLKSVVLTFTYHLWNQEP